MLKVYFEKPSPDIRIWVFIFIKIKEVLTLATLNKNKAVATAPKEDKNVMLNHEGGVVHKLNPLEVLFSKIQGSRDVCN